LTKNITESKIDASNDWRGFAEELKKESPRAAVILGASFLDINWTFDKAKLTPSQAGMKK